MIVVLTTVNLLLGTMLSARLYFRGSPFYIMILLLNGLVVFPTYFSVPGAVVDFHAFANPILIDLQTLVRSQEIVFWTYIVFLVAEFFRRKKLPYLTVFAPPKAFLFFPVILLATIALVAIIYGLNAILMLDFVALRSGAIGYGPLFIQYFSILSAPLVALWFYSGHIFKALFSFCVILLASMLIGGSRQTLVVSILLFFVLGVNRGWLSFAITTIVIVFLFPFLDSLITVIKFIRNLPDVVSRIDFIASLDFSAVEASSESVLRYVYFSLVSFGENVSDFGNFTYLRRMAFFWLPSAIDAWSMKPEDFEFVVFWHIMGGRVGSMHPTFFGIIYSDALSWFPIWAFFAYAMIYVMERMLLIVPRNHYSYFWGLLVYVSVMWARGSLYAPILVLSASLLFLILFLVCRQAVRMSTKRSA